MELESKTIEEIHNPIYEFRKNYFWECLYETRNGKKEARGDLFIHKLKQSEINAGKILGEGLMNINRTKPNSEYTTNPKGKIITLDNRILLDLNFSPEFDIFHGELDYTELRKYLPINGNAYQELKFKGEYFSLSGSEHTRFYKTQNPESKFKWFHAELYLTKTHVALEKPESLTFKKVLIGIANFWLEKEINNVKKK